jgi:hypothetical protein
LIVITSLAAVYYYFDETLLSTFLSIAAFISLIVGGIYIAFFTAYKLFPQSNQAPLPPISKLFYYLGTNFKHPFRSKTFVAGAVFAFGLVILGLLAWAKLSSSFKEYHLERFGRTTKAYITDFGYEEDYGTYRKFEFQDEKGRLHNSRYLNTSLEPGTPITIRYSVKKPSIIEVIEPGYSP